MYKSESNEAATDELVFANDYAVLARSDEDIRLLSHCFVHAAEHLGLAATLKKADFLFQPRSGCAKTIPALPFD